MSGTNLIESYEYEEAVNSAKRYQANADWIGAATCWLRAVEIASVHRDFPEARYCLARAETAFGLHDSKTQETSHEHP
jgi:hypothetical protein